MRILLDALHIDLLALCIHCYNINMTKDYGLHISVQSALREGNHEVCRTQDKPGTQLILESMRNYAERHDPSAEPAVGRTPVGRANAKEGA